MLALVFLDFSNYSFVDFRFFICGFSFLNQRGREEEFTIDDLEEHWVEECKPMPDQRRKGKDAEETFALDNKSFDTAAENVAEKAGCSKTVANEKRKDNILPSKRNNEHCIECYSRRRVLSWWKQYVRGVTFLEDINQIDDQPYLQGAEFANLRVKRMDLGENGKWAKARICDIADLKKRQALLKVIDF